jgi:hypothetical protein
MVHTNDDFGVVPQLKWLVVLFPMLYLEFGTIVGEFSILKNEFAREKRKAYFPTILLPSASLIVLLFCSWPCLHQWLETRPNRQVCPVCKAAISKEKVVPLYGRGSTKQEDPRLIHF